MAEAVRRAGRQVKPITLDRLDWGTEESLEEEYTKSRKDRRSLPETITSKELYRDIVQIAWPSLCELFLTSLVSMVDTMMVGGLGGDAISAVSLATQPKFLFMNLFMALNTGTTAMVSRARGKQDRDEADRILRQSMVLVTFIGLASAFFGYLFSEPLIRFMANGGLEDSVIRESTGYLRIQFLFFPFLAWTSVITATLKGTGQAKPSMVYNTIANLVNICFNWLLINGHWGFPRMEVAGASLATGLGQFTAFAIALWCAFSGRFYCTLRLKNLLRFDRSIVSGIVTVGVPSMIEQLIMRFGVVMFTRTLASLGSVQFATHNICMNIQSMSFMIGQGFAVSSTSLVGQSLGKKRPDMAEHYSRRCRNLGLYAAVVIGLLFFIFRRSLVGFYNWGENRDEEILRLGSYLMIYVAILQPFQCNQFILGGSLRGAGDTRFTALVMLITIVGIRTVLAWLLVTLLDLGLTGAWIAVSADQITRSFIILGRYNRGKWKKIRL
ncbi:MAG: MATE family efflux transporter [Oscillospiraceae bacterium]|nr:MATE family efflux transporter [Oscillospiraceae bacterium]